MKTPANTKARALRAKLQALVARGVAGEASSAQAKLSKLESRYDFNVPNPDGADLFADAVFVRRGNQRPLSEVFHNSEIACFVKWALQSAFKLDALIRDRRDGTFTLEAECAVESLKSLNHVARQLRIGFETLWQTFRELPGATDRDARTFLRGLWDSCMGDERPAGQMLPARVAPAVKGRTRKRGLALPPALAVHPYEAGLALGGKIRLQIPIEQIAGDLQDADRLARLN